MHIVDNGHTIQLNYDFGSSVAINGKKFDLLQFHFHAPSENIMNGKPFDMEVHLVHKAKDGQLAVIAVFMTNGKKNDFIQTVWDNLPSEKGNIKSVKSIKVNAMNMLPSDKAFYRFSGSLTTPPCSEGVVWSTMKSPIEISSEQIGRFKKLYSMNARPVQPLNDREIIESM